MYNLFILWYPHGTVFNVSVCLRGIKSFPVFCGGSEILNPLLCSWGDQKFWILYCALWGIRNSESSPVFMGGSEILNPLLCFVGDQKFWIITCVHGGIRNSESFPVFIGGSEILNPLLCFVRDQKFWILSCLHVGIRNSESSPVFCGGSEILNPLLMCSWGIRISESSHAFSLGKTSRHEIQKIIWLLMRGSDIRMDFR